MIPRYRHALIIGAGSGLSAALARRFAGEGLAVSLAARDTTKLTSLVSEIGAAAFRCDAGQRSSIATLFEALDQSPAGAPDVLVYNPSARQRGPLLELDPEAVARAVEITALGAFHAAQEAARRIEGAQRRDLHSARNRLRIELQQGAALTRGGVVDEHVRRAGR
ncbi:MAG: SDR family NAD(P)-dependent oxidoreductase, partial [Pseudomonadota bacterium]